MPQVTIEMDELSRLSRERDSLQRDRDGWEALAKSRASQLAKARKKNKKLRATLKRYRNGEVGNEAAVETCSVCGERDHSAEWKHGDTEDPALDYTGIVGVDLVESSTFRPFQ